MTATTTTAALVPIQPAFSDAERLALAGYRGLTREAYALDLRQFTAWCRSHSVKLFAMLARYRRRGAARALLGQAFAVLAARGATSVAGEVDDTNVASLSLLTGLGARRYGGTVELIRRQPRRSARGWPEERRPSAGR